MDKISWTWIVIAYVLSGLGFNAFFLVQDHRKHPTQMDDVPVWKRIGAHLAMMVVATPIWPYLALDMAVRKIIASNPIYLYIRAVIQGKKSITGQDYLFFNRMGGAGTICCKSCGNKQHVTSFIHGRSAGGNRWCRAGMQCQSCRHLCAIEGEKAPHTGECQCGGKLSRDARVVCPECGSKHVKYYLRIMT